MILLLEDLRRLVLNNFVFHKVKERNSKKWKELIENFYKAFGNECYSLTYTMHARDKVKIYEEYLPNYDFEAPICFVKTEPSHYNSVHRKIYIAPEGIAEIGFDKQTNYFSHLLVNFLFRNTITSFVLIPKFYNFIVKTVTIMKKEDLYKFEFLPSLYLYNKLVNFDINQFKFEFI